MTEFVTSLWAEYPLPQEVSVWSDLGVNVALDDLDTLIANCVREVASDVQITETMPSNGQKTLMPSDCITVRFCKMNLPYQGNRLIKYDYDRGSKMCYVRYIPCNITYTRYLRVEDLDNLYGDQRIYVKDYILNKMATKELQLLKGVEFKTDNGTIDYTILEDFAKEKKENIDKLKEGILIYSSHF